jgi:hypothetical protein
VVGKPGVGIARGVSGVDGTLGGHVCGDNTGAVAPSIASMNASDETETCTAFRSLTGKIHANRPAPPD